MRYLLSQAATQKLDKIWVYDFEQWELKQA